VSGTLPARRRAVSDALRWPLACASPQSNPQARLVCFAHAGGGCGAYRPWSAPLAPEVEVWTGSLPGRAMRGGEPFARTWDGLGDEFADAIAPPDGDVPVALLGHSMGGLLAFEVARALERRSDVVPAHLFVSGCRAPDRLEPDRRVPADDASLIREVDVRYGALPPAVRAEPELLRRFLPVLRADLELAAAYVFAPGPPLRCPITALAGSEDRATALSELPYWEHHTEARCQTAALPGGHFFLHSELRTMAAFIRRALIPAR
jgi:surfactin synthase thioesterase subunit